MHSLYWQLHKLCILQLLHDLRAWLLNGFRSLQDHS
jgi:hypothetical protein